MDEDREGEGDEEGDDYGRDGRREGPGQPTREGGLFHGGRNVFVCWKGKPGDEVSGVILGASRESSREREDLPERSARGMGRHVTVMGSG